MPTFFFDTEINGYRSVDTDGVCLPDLSAARREGRLALCELVAEIDADPDWTQATMSVRNRAGDVVLTFSMSLTALAAAS